MSWQVKVAGYNQMNLDKANIYDYTPKEFVEKIVTGDASISTRIEDLQITTGYMQEFLYTHAVMWRSTISCMFLRDDNGKRATELTHLTPRFILENLKTENGTSVISQAEFGEDDISINEAIGQLKWVYGMYCDPEGKQIRSFLDETVMACYVASKIPTKRGRPKPENLTKLFINLLTTLGVKDTGDEPTPWDMYRTIFETNSDMQKVFRKLQTAPRLSARWADSVSAVRIALRNFEEEAILYCTANMNAYSGDQERLRALIQLWKEQSEVKDLMDPQTIAPWFFFRASEPKFVSGKVDARFFRTMRGPLVLSYMGASGNKTKLNRLLRDRALKQAWKLFARLTFIVEQDVEIIREVGSKLNPLRSGNDPMLDPKFVSDAIKAVLDSSEIPRQYAEALVDLARAATPLLQTVDKITAEVGEQSDILEGGGSGGILSEATKEQQLTKYRTQPLVQKKSTDSGMMLPIILMGGLVFLMSS